MSILPAPSSIPELPFHSCAPTPPMGWNSWDCFGTTVTEAQTRAHADYMAQQLKEHGWQYVVVDIQWYEPNAKGHDYRPGAPLIMDGFGRLLPDPGRFPSSRDGNGFQPLADYVHGLGLKFGIHLMRGIPRQAFEYNTPVLGTNLHAKDIANTDSVCTWNPDMYGVDLRKPGAQAYYNSVFDQIAEWGVDFIKVDDISRPYHDNEAEIEAIRTAIDQTGRPIVLSLSPGATALTASEHVARHANMWRISDDFWDDWTELRKQFDRLRDWTPYRGKGFYPDADMLPLGTIAFGRPTHFSKDEQFTLMTLWAIAQSPLMFGGDLTQMDAFTLSLLTNDLVLAVNQTGSQGHECLRKGDQIAWLADIPNGTDKYLALFNTGETTLEFPLSLNEIGITGSVRIHDLWRDVDLGVQAGVFSAQLNPHASGLYRIRV